MKKNNIRIIGRNTLLLLLLVFSIAAVIYNCAIPDIISVYNGDSISELSLPFVSIVYREPSVFASTQINPDNLTNSTNEQSCVLSHEAQAVAFGIIPIKSVEVNVFKRISLYPGGMTFGVKLYTDGVMLVGISDIVTDKGNVCPAYEAGLRIKDIILKINDISVTTADKIIELVEKSEGKPIHITVRRADKEYTFILEPVYSSEDTGYRAGIWIRDSAAGIGTVTYINPADNTFGGLGHGITDVDTGELMPLLHGSVSGVSLSGITKGKEGSPGELMGYFTSSNSGALLGNTKSGIYGFMSELPGNIACDPIPIALKSEITEGAAIIYSTDGKEGVAAYDVMITGINKNDSDYKNFIIEVVDSDLLELTGGIVQGMSGSPVIQNGRIIGAITHVMINDPKKGFGVFIENMLRNMPKTTVK